MQRESHKISVDPWMHLSAHRVRPEGPAVATVLFVHGRTFASVPDFDLQVPGAERTHSFMEYLAARGIDTWCFDHRGFGKSWKPRDASPFTARTRGEDLLQVLPYVRERAVGPFSIIGLSLGCAAAAHALQVRPEACDRLILMGPSRWRTLTGWRARLSWLWSSLKAGAKRSIYIHVRFDSAEERLWKGEESRIDRAAFEQFVYQAMSADPEAPKDRVRALISTAFPYDFWDPVIKVPVLVIRGSEDTLATAEDIETIRRLIPPELLAVRIFPDRKHDLHIYHQRDDVFECINEFVRQPLRVTASDPAHHADATHSDRFSAFSRNDIRSEPALATGDSNND